MMALHQATHHREALQSKVRGDLGIFTLRL